MTESVFLVVAGRTSTLQYTKPEGASYIVALSTQEKCANLLALVDYRKENWWEIEDFKRTKLTLYWTWLMVVIGKKEDARAKPSNEKTFTPLLPAV